ncbi:MAG: lactonase family protein [Acidobacteria bacterium]|nr:lactonase family protein [Acidobacteriota bacterium]
MRNSRRSFLLSGAAFGIAAAHRTRLAAAAGLKPLFAYVGTYTLPVDGSGNGKGIYVCEVDRGSGELKQMKLAVETVNPSWLSLHPSGKYLYAVNEVSTFEGNSGSVTSFAIDPQTRELRTLNTVNSGGAGPAHMSVDATGKFAFVANYNGGSVAVLPILGDGRLGPACFEHKDAGSLGPKRASNAPQGSFAISGHDAPHAHMIQADPRNHFVLYADLGQDRIYVNRFDADKGQLTPAANPFVTFPPGDGPRHFVFHPNGRWFYSIQEEGSTISFFGYDEQSGALAHQQTLSTLPAGYEGTNFCSEIAISHDGRFVYGVNRLHDSIATFSIGTDGRLQHLDDTPTEGDYPRYIALSPDGGFLYACNQRSDVITTFRVDAKGGRLLFTGKYSGVGSPACIVFCG